MLMPDQSYWLYMPCAILFALTVVLLVHEVLTTTIINGK